MAYEDLTGKRFGRLVVLSQALSSKRGRSWLCQCDCGNQKILCTSHLNSGKVKSCGCLRKSGINNRQGGRKIEDLTGQVFGWLTPLESTNQRSNGSVIWKCKCKCGNIIYASARNLKLGVRTSCGCVHSIGEANIADVLRNNNIDFIKEYSVTLSNGMRRYDFAILNENNKLIRLIEFDGPQHTQPQKGYYEGLFTTIKQHDQEKNLWAKQNNIPLVRIPYYLRDNITLEDLMGDKYIIN